MSWPRRQGRAGAEEGPPERRPVASSCWEHGAGGAAGLLTEDGQVLARGPWLDNSGKHGQTWPLCPWLP